MNAGGQDGRQLLHPRVSGQQCWICRSRRAWATRIQCSAQGSSGRNSQVIHVRTWPPESRARWASASRTASGLNRTVRPSRKQGSRPSRASFASHLRGRRSSRLSPLMVQSLDFGMPQRYIMPMGLPGVGVGDLRGFSAWRNQAAGTLCPALRDYRVPGRMSFEDIRKALRL